MRLKRLFHSLASPRTMTPVISFYAVEFAYKNYVFDCLELKMVLSHATFVCSLNAISVHFTSTIL